VQAFVRRRSQERQLTKRLHAIWFVCFGSCNRNFKIFVFRYCIPMDNDRPSLDLANFDKICPDKDIKGTSKIQLFEMRVQHKGFL
jgi:hypothetical protein